MIKVKQIAHNTFKFPGGEIGVKLSDGTVLHTAQYDFEALITSSDELIELMMLVDAVRRVASNRAELRLRLYYTPYGRQDRVANFGESLSIKVFAELINLCKFDEVLIIDPHSDVTPALINRSKVITQSSVMLRSTTLTKLSHKEGTYLVAPDAGAAKKAAKVADLYKLNLLTATKERDTQTGKLSNPRLDVPSDAKRLIMVDDICDGGATFIQLVQLVPETVQSHLVVTHGIFSKGTKVLTDLYDSVEAIYSFPNAESLYLE